MTLQELFERSYVGLTDKGDTHDYIQGYYQKEFEDKRNAILNILEIGVFYGGSMMMFSDWLPGAEFDGIDINEPMYMKDRTKVMNAYSQEALSMYEDDYYDYIIDDGPHTLESMIYVTEHWMKKLKSGGKLIIEDVQSIEWCKEIEKAATGNGLFKFTIFDLRERKNRYDDILIEILKL
jgi:hypothetical protein